MVIWAAGEADDLSEAPERSVCLTEVWKQTAFSEYKSTPEDKSTQRQALADLFEEKTICIDKCHS